MPPPYNPGEFTLTAWLDPALKFFADQAEIPVDQYVAQTGGEGIAAGIELVTDLFLTEFLNKLVQLGLGIGFGCYALWGKPTPRLRRELVTMANHQISRIVDPKPRDIIAIRENIAKLAEGLARGRADIAMEGRFRKPEELAEMLEALGVPAVAVRGGGGKSPKYTGSRPSPPGGGSPEVLRKVKVDEAERIVVDKERIRLGVL